MHFFKKQLILSVFALGFSIGTINAQCHIYALMAIKYNPFNSSPMGTVTAYKIKIMPCIDDSIQLKKLWVGNRRYLFFGRERGIQLYRKKYPGYGTREQRIAIPYSKESKYYYQKIQKKYLPPVKYNGVGLVEYYYNGKTYYYTIPYWDEYEWKLPTGRGIPPEYDILKPPHQFQYKQQ